MNSLEWIASLATILSVIMLGKCHVFGWVFGIVGCSLYGIIFLEEGLLANTFIQIIFILQGIYGIYSWKKTEQKEFISIKYDYASLLLIFSLTLGIALILSVCFCYCLPNSFSIIDIFLSICSLLAMIMLLKKMIHAWLFWMAIDLGYIFFFIHLNMYVSAGLYMLLFLLCIKNFREWSLKKIEYKTV